MDLYARTMRCRACGATVSVDAQRCPQCGGAVVGPILALALMFTVAFELLVFVYFCVALRNVGSAFCILLFSILPCTVLGFIAAYIARPWLQRRLRR